MKYIIIKTFKEMAYIQLVQEQGFLKKLTVLTNEKDLPEDVDCGLVATTQQKSSESKNTSGIFYCKELKDCIQYLKFPVYNIPEIELEKRVLELLVEKSDLIEDINSELIGAEDADEAFERIFGPDPE